MISGIYFKIVGEWEVEGTDDTVGPDWPLS